MSVFIYSFPDREAHLRRVEDNTYTAEELQRLLVASFEYISKLEEGRSSEAVDMRRRLDDAETEVDILREDLHEREREIRELVGKLSSFPED